MQSHADPAPRASGTVAATTAEPPRADPDEIRRALVVLFAPDDIIELRAFAKRGRKRTDAGYFDGDHREELVQHAVRLNREGASVYVVVNRINPQLISRYANRIAEHAERTATDKDVTRRRWLPIDLDPIRPSDTSATDEQIELAMAKARVIYAALRDDGFGGPVVAASGNGAHLLLPIDWPNDDAAKDRAKAMLESLGERFDDSAIKVDTSCFNAARIIKLYGTVANKGDHLPQYPHRLARIVLGGSRHDG